MNHHTRWIVQLALLLSLLAPGCDWTQRTGLPTESVVETTGPGPVDIDTGQHDFEQNTGGVTHVPPIADTPELDSLLLFGSGLLGASGYALQRVRSSRPRRKIDPI